MALRTIFFFVLWTNISNIAGQQWILHTSIICKHFLIQGLSNWPKTCPECVIEMVPVHAPKWRRQAVVQRWRLIS